MDGLWLVVAWLAAWIVWEEFRAWRLRRVIAGLRQAHSIGGRYDG
jgi:hypothetical protein